MTLTAERLFARLCRIQALAVLVIVALAYPLRIDAQKLSDWASGALPERLAGAFINGFQNVLCFACSAIVLKETLVCIATLALLFFFALWRAFWPRDDPDEWRQILTAMGVLVLASLSALWWSPTYYYSLTTLTRVLCLSGFYCVVASLARRDDILRRGAVLIVLISAVLAFISLLQQFDLAPGVLVKIEDPRNRIGSFIGHNTGLSVYLAFALFIAVSLLCGRAPRPAKTLLACLAGVLAFNLVLAQSRSVWAILAVAAPWLLIRLRRHTGVGPRARHWAAMAAIAAAIIASQLIESPLNVLSVRQYPLLRRLKDLGPDQLRTETRLRVAVCSLPLIAKSPLIGYGLGSFQHVYPEAQMRYYVAHPFMWIAPTAKRSQHAHDDYLQLLIETGVIGFALALALLFLELRRGFRAQRLALGRDARGEMARFGVSFALLVFGIQAALDFPCHIISLATTCVFMLAAWSATPASAAGAEAAEREPATVSVGGEARGGAAGRGGGPASRRWRPPHATRSAPEILAATVISAVSLFLVGLGLVFFGRQILGDYHNTAANGAYLYVVQQFSRLRQSEKVQILNHIDTVSREGERMEPLMMEAKANHAQALELLGEVLMDQRRESWMAGRREEAEQISVLAASNLKMAAAMGAGALKEFRNHVTYSIIGAAYSDLFQMTQAEAEFNKAAENLEMAARYSPAYAGPIYSLYVLYRQTGAKPARALELLAMIARYDPPSFENLVFRKYRDLWYNEEYDKALATGREIMEALEYNAQHDARLAPPAAQMADYLVQNFLLAGKTAEAEAELSRGEKLYPDPRRWLRARALLLCKTKQWSQAAEAIHQLTASEAATGADPLWDTAEALVAREMGAGDADAKVQAIMIGARQDAAYYELLGQVERDWLGHPSEALQYLERRCRLKPKADARIFGQAAILSWDLGAAQQALAYAQEALTLNPRYDRMRDLMKQVQSNGAAGKSRP